MKYKLVIIIIMVFLPITFLYSYVDKTAAKDTVDKYINAIKNQEFIKADSYLAPNVIEIIKVNQLLNNPSKPLDIKVKEAFINSLFNELEYSIDKIKIHGNSVSVSVLLKSKDFEKAKKNTFIIGNNSMNNFIDLTKEEVLEKWNNITIDQLNKVDKKQYVVEIPLKKFSYCWLITDTTSLVDAIAGGSIYNISDLPQIHINY